MVDALGEILLSKMPSRSQPRNDITMPAGDIGSGFERRRSSRKHSATSKAVKEKALSPRPSLGSRERIKADFAIRPPHADLPVEFVKSCGSGVSVQTTTGGNRHRNGNKEGELVKHMSSLPGFLLRGEKPQDKILNFGVLDWERLESWKHKQMASTGQSRASASTSHTSHGCPTSTKVPSIVVSDAVRTEVLPSRKEETSLSEIFLSEKVEESYSSSKLRRKSRKDKSCGVGVTTSEKRSHGSKGRDKESLDMGMPSSKPCTHKKNVSDDSHKKSMEKCSVLESDPTFQHHHKQQDSIVLLLPKDFSRSGRLDDSEEIFFSGDSAELNWNTFSDVFSIEELHFEESAPDVPHSCPLPCMAGNVTEELDVNLDRIIHDQRMQIPSEGNLSAHLDYKHFPSREVDHEARKKKEPTSSATYEASEGLDHKTSHVKPSDTMDPPPTRHFSFGIGRLTRSLSFREGSTLPQLKQASIRSGPAQASNYDDSAIDKPVNGTSKGRISPFRKLLNPILKPKVANPVNLADSSLPCTENLKNLQAVHIGKYGTTSKSAVLQLTVKSGLPLFEFCVETDNEILASNVKKLSTFGRDDPSRVYSFYSVQEVKRKSGSWIYQGRKAKTPDISYTVIGQMKVSKPLPCGDEEKLEEEFMRESVLYGVNLSNVDEEGLEPSVSRELGAIVVKVPKDVSGDDQKKCDGNDTVGVITPGSIVVILPGAVHSLPRKGVPASLIDRWRTGGLCDCGGWDVGCKLQILANKDQGNKLLRSWSAYSLQQHCNLFLQGTGKQNKPVFRLLARGEGFYSVEYDSAITSLQAFAISVAVLNDEKQQNVSEASSYPEERKGHYRSMSSIVQGEGTRYATYPPHSPVSRA